MKKALGGERLGSGKKMDVELHGYSRSTHDLGYIWRNTQSAGTLVPFLVRVALPGDTFDINLDMDIKTHPTVGPLFGSFKAQADIFLAPIRLYQGQLHNNKLKIGLKMSNVKLPFIKLKAMPATTNPDLDNSQINPSCILSYLGIRGVGVNTTDTANLYRNFNAVPFLSVWDIYKNYYANKSEEIGAVIHGEDQTTPQTVDEIEMYSDPNSSNGLLQSPASFPIQMYAGGKIRISYTGAQPNPGAIMVKDTDGFVYSLEELYYGWYKVDGEDILEAFPRPSMLRILLNWRYKEDGESSPTAPKVVTFPLENIDTMREEILAWAIQNTAFDVFTRELLPYNYLFSLTGAPSYTQTQEGLPVKTYQSDLFNNWLSTEWIDGSNGINEIFQ